MIGSQPKKFSPILSLDRSVYTPADCQSHLSENVNK